MGGSVGNPEHIAIAHQGVATWNEWRTGNLRVQPDLTRIDLSGRDLRGIDFRGVGLFKANLSYTNLAAANLRQSILIKTRFVGANLTGAHIYGASVWDVDLTDALQTDLVVTDPSDTATVTIDNLEMAQFIHLMLTNRKIREIIDAITSKVVLILGRFTPDCRVVLEELKSLLRESNLVPVLFDFTGPSSRNTTETVRTLAHLARFVIVDLSTPASVPQELQAIVPLLRLPIAPIIRAGEKPYPMFADFAQYPWVLKVIEYADLPDLRSRVFPSLRQNVEQVL
jgi:Pentapeptide repeats (8 copies)